MAQHDKTRLKIISPEGNLLEADVEVVTLPGTYGEFTVYPHHAPLISSLERGEIKFDSGDDKVQSIAIDAGFVEVRANVVTACVTTIK